MGVGGEKVGDQGGWSGRAGVLCICHDIGVGVGVVMVVMAVVVMEWEWSGQLEEYDERHQRRGTGAGGRANIAIYRGITYQDIKVLRYRGINEWVDE